MFTLLVFLLFPLGIGGVSGAPTAATAAGEFYVPALAKIVGSGPAGVILVLLIGSLFLSMISSTADGSRALYGIARDDMTVKQLYHLNRFHVPARAMTVDLVVNVLLVLFISSNLAILYLSNIGYVLAHVFALSGFLLLRRDRPNWPRPIKVGPIWVGIAAVLVVFNTALVIFGVLNPTLTGYGTWTDMFIGVGVLIASVLLFFYRRIVQDKEKVTFREEVPADAVRGADGAAARGGSGRGRLTRLGLQPRWTGTLAARRLLAGLARAPGPAARVSSRGTASCWSGAGRRCRSGRTGTARAAPAPRRAVPWRPAPRRRSSCSRGWSRR